MPIKPKAIFFDLDETLVENKIPVPKLFARMYFDFQDQLGAENQDRFFAVLRERAKHLWSSMFDTEAAPEQQFIDCFAACIGALNVVPEFQQKSIADAMFEHYLELSSKNIVLHDGVEHTLKELSSQGFITGIITNGMTKIQRGKIHSLELQHKVDHVVVSAEARAHKPAAAVFELALSRAGINAQQAWQIGDHPVNDVAGAIRAGMGGVFYDPSNERLQEAFADVRETPTHVIVHHRDLFALL